MSKKESFFVDPSQTALGQLLKDIKSQVKAAVGNIGTSATSPYHKYQKDPVGFAKEVMKISVITIEQEEALRSVVENPVTILQSANGVGKTFLMAVIAAWAYKCFEECQVYTAAAPPEDNLKRLLWGEIGRVLADNKALFADDKISIPSLEIKRSPLQFITGVTIPQAGDDAMKVARFSGKHSPFLFFLIDEGDALPKAVYEAIESCLSGGFGRLVISYNPRSKTNPVYQKSERNEGHTIILSAFNHPNVRTGRDIVPGAVNREKTCQRIVKWTRPLRRGESLTNTFEVPDFLVGYVATDNDGKTKLPMIEAGRRKIVLPEFAYMVLGLPSSKTSNQLIDREWCEVAMERYRRWVNAHGIVPPTAGKKRSGLDVAEFGVDFSILTHRTGDFVFPQIEWGGVNITEVSRTAEGYCLEYESEEIYVDSNGLGAGVWSNLVSFGLPALRIMVTGSATLSAEADGETLGEFDRIRDQMWWTCREWLKNNPNAMLPDGESEGQFDLIDQLCAATYDRTKYGKIKICDNDVMKAKLGDTSPDKATSLVLTFAPPPDDDKAGDYNSSSYIDDDDNGTRHSRLL